MSVGARGGGRLPCARGYAHQEEPDGHVGASLGAEARHPRPPGDTNTLVNPQQRSHPRCCRAGERERERDNTDLMNMPVRVTCVSYAHERGTRNYLENVSYPTLFGKTPVCLFFGRHAPPKAVNCCTLEHSAVSQQDCCSLGHGSLEQILHLRHCYDTQALPQNMLPTREILVCGGTKLIFLYIWKR